MKAMGAKEVVASSPRQLQIGDQLSSTYQLADDLIAVHGCEGDGGGIATLIDGRIAILPNRALAGRQFQQETLGPVYRLSPGGGIAVPTGRVLVRFRQGDGAEEHGEEMMEAGYLLDQVLPYAPQAAWVGARSGRISDALSNLDRLKSVGGVKNVEPQMISQSAKR